MKARISSPIVNFCQCVDGLFLLSICRLCSGDPSFPIVSIVTFYTSVFS
jgi:hypothetical protein